MVEISINVNNLNDTCRLCLSTGDTLLDIFQYSTEMENRVADVIMKCAPVQIAKCDEMPNSICKLCHTQLEKSHQFQIQIVQSEKTLRNYLQQRASGKKIKTECSEDLLIHDTKADISSKLPISTGCADDIIETKNDGRKNTKNDIDDRKLIEDTEVNEEKKPAIFHSEKIIKEELIIIESEIKDEPMEDNSLNSTEYYADDTIETFSNGYGSEISYEDSKIDVDNTWKNLEGHCSADVIEDFNESAEGHKNTSVNIKINKKASKIAYKCEFCNKSFVYPSSLYNHRRIHTGEKPYQCDMCNKCFTRSTDIIIHKRTHTGEKPYQCDVCNKCFARSTDIIIHKRTHTGEKPYRCDVCNRQFFRSEHLKNHIRTHTGEKPYQCDVCNKCFTRSTDLNRHKRVHTNEKPYQCNVCDKTFKAIVYLNKHMRTHNSMTFEISD